MGTYNRTKVHFLIDWMNHHSSILPFRELARRNSDIVTVTSLELVNVESFIKSSIDETSTLVIGIFCAMSNVTGYGPSVDEIYTINETIHGVGGIVTWDLATFASHRRFDMNPPNRSKAYSDFVFLSPHKLIGGPGTTGLLLGRREWMKNSVPTIPGGGSVFFASENTHSYIQNTQEREEAGTPDIVGCIRVGLVFSLHAKLDMEQVHAREISMSKRVMEIISQNSRVHVLGRHDQTPQPSAIISFNISFGESEARGGCACAGPYSQRLLGLSPNLVDRFNECLQRSGQEIFRPGFVRIGLHWTMSDDEVQVIGDAINWIAQNGWKLLSVYTADIETGEWKHRIANHDADRDWLSDFKFFEPPDMMKICSEIPVNDLVTAADAALAHMHDQVPLGTVRNANTNSEYDDLVWFAMPGDSKKVLETGIWTEYGQPPNRIIHALTDRDTTPKIINETVQLEPIAKKRKKFQVPKKLRALATQAITDYSMIKEGDRILIGISGGKDSLSLLHILLECQRKCPFRFEIAAATVDPQVPEYQPHALKEYMESMGVRYHYLSQPIVEIAKTAMTGKQSICAFCSRMKRGMLYSCMRENGYNVLALGQHLDDLVESFLMSCFRNGAMRTMKANYFVKDRDLRVIRPLIYVREKMTADFASEANLPIIRDNCPACFAAPKERHRIKVLLSHEEFQNPHLFASMLQSMKPIIGISSAMSTRELIEGRMFPFGNMDDEDEDQGAEETLLPCSDGACPLPSK
jgi:tRNA(Ile)-lysidine synthase TilS/MesJ/selenocysteine lyase/cysteine desulfurase